jgi:hypothetical protein
MKRQNNNLTKDLLIIVFSIAVAILMVKTGALETLLLSTQEVKFLGSFVAGMFFISIFSAAPAGVVLVELARSCPVLEVALWGGLGALVGDLIIFSFAKDRLGEDLSDLVKQATHKKLSSILQLKLFRWTVPFLGALIVASPFPDELGLAMMGLSKMRTSLFIPLSFLLNFLGILVLGIIARATL